MSGRSSRSVWSAGLVTATVAAGLFAAAPAGAVTGPEAKDGAYAYTAKLDIGEGKRSCTATLVDAQWVVTAASCFTDTAQQATSLAHGKPSRKTTATVGRADLGTTAGLVTEVVELVPQAGRDLVLARLAQPATGVSPVALAAAAPAKGEVLKSVGFGRTKTEWVPNKAHTAAATVDGLAATTVNFTGKSLDDSLCKGDTGAPLLREKDGKAELVGVNVASWQGGCLGAAAGETRTGAVATRTDDLGDWIRTTVKSNTGVVGVGSGRCLDVPNDKGTTTPMLWDCWGGNNQKWTYTADKELRVFGDMCLDAAGGGTEGGTPLIIWSCNGGANQKWNLNADGSITGVPSNLCVDVSHEATENGSPVGLWYCNGGNHQKWNRV
ncbi:ricin-type beta-trefoil lectin domain protein [Streptomyces sp. UNOB3_S3]|uniref:ricin-type beta-trefoil lectin domain protein n=1 Tax=Streptomyces sp. UNOB3_S3 TaxID=2871682 RepID=UPI001E4C74F2|nr:ricin-type beta-trefoil lectin domain protein [Streptomyces sp. UNOB3_S3]